MNTPLLTVENLDIRFQLHEKTVHAVRNISFKVAKGETLALVGESGSGKSVTAMSLMRLLPENTTCYGKDSRITFDGTSILDADEKTLRSLRGGRISFIVDIEDAYQIRQIEHRTAWELLADLAGDMADGARLAAMDSKSDQLAYLRAKAIGRLVHETVAVFQENEAALLAGARDEPLLKTIPSIDKLAALRAYAEKHIYISRPVVEVQIAGHRVLTGLMQTYCQAVANTHGRDHHARADQMILALLPERYQKGRDTLYRKLLGVCDYVAGMTDSYAVSLYKKLTGISLPVN